MRVISPAEQVFHVGQFPETRKTPQSHPQYLEHGMTPVKQDGLRQSGRPDVVAVV
jgi:hypothetical protein